MAFRSDNVKHEISDIFGEAADRVSSPGCEIEFSIAYREDNSMDDSQKDFSLIAANTNYDFAKNSSGEVVTLPREVEYGIMSHLEVVDPE